MATAPFDAATDGVAMLRRFLGVSQAAFGVLAGICAQRTTASAPIPRVLGLYVTGAASSNDTGDGLVILRAMRARPEPVRHRAPCHRRRAQSVEHTCRRQQQHPRMAERQLWYLRAMMQAAADSEKHARHDTIRASGGGEPVRLGCR